MQPRRDRRCPRCFHVLPIHMFQEPVVICMVCYGGLPANTGLDLYQLKAKAKESRWARRYSKKTNWEDRLRTYTNSPAAEKEQRDFDEAYTVDMCSLCEKSFNIDELVRTLGNKSHPDCTIVCQPCADRIQLEDEQLLKDEATSDQKDV